MAINTTAAYGLYSQDASLNNVVQSLNSAGFNKEDICMMLPPSHPIAALVRDANLFNSEGASNAGTANLIGWLSEFGAVMIPTVGFFIRSQAFFRALMASREAPALCGNASSLAGLGFAQPEADKFERQLRDVGVMVYVACAETARTMWACEVLRHTGASEAATLDQLMGSGRVAAAAA